jgi:hypothetical protein
VFTGVVVIAIVGSLAAFTMSAPRVYYAMARDRLFLSWAARLHPRYETPARAIFIQTTLAVVLVLVGNFDDILSYFLFAVVLFIGLTVAALFLLRREGRAADFMTPLYPATPAVYLLLTALLLFLLASDRPKYALTGVAVVALGLPFYYLVFRRTAARPEGDERDGLLDEPMYEQEEDVKRRAVAESEPGYTVTLLFACIFVASVIIAAILLRAVRLDSDTPIWVAIFTAIISAIGTISTAVLAWRSDRRDAREKELKIEQLERELEAAREMPKLTTSHKKHK